MRAPTPDAAQSRSVSINNPSLRSIIAAATPRRASAAPALRRARGRFHRPTAAAAMLRAARSDRKPNAAPPREPVTKSRSPGRAPARVTGPSCTAPTTVTVSDSSPADAKLPPTSAPPARRAPSRTPATIARRLATGSIGGAASASTAATTRPPIAATSLALTSNARRPSSRGDSQRDRKCTPSTMASVVTSSGAPIGAKTAASSPTPSTTPGPRGTRRRIASTRSRSPRSRRRSVMQERRRPPREPRSGSLAEHLLDLLEEALAHRVHLLAGHARELLEQLALARGELARRLDDDAHEVVAAPVAVEIGDALALQLEDRPRLRPRRNAHPQLSLERRHLEVGAERRLREADRHVADDVVLFATEQGVILHTDDDVEVARRAAGRARLPFAPQLEARPGVDAGWNLHAQALRATHGPLAAALRTGIADRAAAAVTLSAHLRDAEEALLEAHLPGAAAGGALLRRRSGLRAFAVAGLARRHARQRDRLLDAERRLLEREVEVVAQILAAAGAALRPSAARLPEEVAEDAAEDVLEAGVEVEAAAAEAVERGVTEPVVLRPAVGVGEHLIRRRRFLEPLLGFLVAGIPIRMELERHLTIGALQLLVVAPPIDAENLVEIP